MKFITENWFVIVAILACAAAGGYTVYAFVKMPSDKQLNKVREWLLYAVTTAEKELGGGTSYWDPAALSAHVGLLPVLDRL